MPRVWKIPAPPFDLGEACEVNNYRRYRRNSKTAVWERGVVTDLSWVASTWREESGRGYVPRSAEVDGRWSVTVVLDRRLPAKTLPSGYVVRYERSIELVVGVDGVRRCA
jgi:hypothetical protein